MVEHSKHPVRVPDGELDDFIERYLRNVGAVQTPQVVLEDESGRQVMIKPERGSSVVVSEYEYEHEP